MCPSSWAESENNPNHRFFKCFLLRDTSFLQAWQPFCQSRPPVLLAKSWEHVLLSTKMMKQVWCARQKKLQQACSRNAPYSKVLPSAPGTCPKAFKHRVAALRSSTWSDKMISFSCRRLQFLSLFYPEIHTDSTTLHENRNVSFLQDVLVTSSHTPTPNYTAMHIPDSSSYQCSLHPRRTVTKNRSDETHKVGTELGSTDKNWVKENVCCESAAECSP